MTTKATAPEQQNERSLAELKADTKALARRLQTFAHQRPDLRERFGLHERDEESWIAAIGAAAKEAKREKAEATTPMGRALVTFELDTMPARFARLKQQREARELFGAVHSREKVELERPERELLEAENADRWPHDMGAKRSVGPMRFEGDHDQGCGR